MHAAVAQSEFESSNVLKSTPVSERFWRFGCSKSARGFGAKHMSKTKCKKTPRSDRFSWQARWIPHLAKNEPNMRFLRRPSNMFRGQRADFLREVAFWSIRSSGSLR